MEYFLGSLITLIISFIVYNKISSDQKVGPKLRIQYSQSYVYSVIYPRQNYIGPGIKKKLVTQATKNIQAKSFPVAITDQEAYWIKDNVLYVAKLNNGVVDENTTKRVDIMALDKVELNKISIIVEKLNEEAARDNRNSGNEEFF